MHRVMCLLPPAAVRCSATAVAGVGGPIPDDFVKPIRPRFAAADFLPPKHLSFGFLKVDGLFRKSCSVFWGSGMLRCVSRRNIPDFSSSPPILGRGRGWVDFMNAIPIYQGALKSCQGMRRVAQQPASSPDNFFLHPLLGGAHTVGSLMLY